MQPIQILILTLGFCIIVPVFSEETRPPVSMHELNSTRTLNEEKRTVKLIDLSKREAKKVERDSNEELKLLPNRIYQRYEPALKKWVFDLTGPNSKFKDPPRVLMPLSDIPGEWAGASKDVAYVYVGPPKKKWDLWKEIKRKEATGKYMFWNLTDPPEESIHYHSRTDDDF